MVHINIFMNTQSMLGESSALDIVKPNNCWYFFFNIWVHYLYTALVVMLNFNLGIHNNLKQNNHLSHTSRKSSDAFVDKLKWNRFGTVSWCQKYALYCIVCMPLKGLGKEREKEEEERKGGDKKRQKNEKRDGKRNKEKEEGKGREKERQREEGKED